MLEIGLYYTDLAVNDAVGGGRAPERGPSREIPWFREVFPCSNPLCVGVDRHEEGGQELVRSGLSSRGRWYRTRRNGSPSSTSRASSSARRRASTR